MNHQTVTSKENSELLSRINECAAAGDWAECRMYLLDYCEGFGVEAAKNFIPSDFDEAVTIFEFFYKSCLVHEPEDSPAGILFSRILDLLAKHSPDNLKQIFYVGLRDRFPAIFEQTKWLTPHGEPCFTVGEMMEKFSLTLSDIDHLLESCQEEGVQQ